MIESEQALAFDAVFSSNEHACVEFDRIEFFVSRDLVFRQNLDMFWRLLARDTLKLVTGLRSCPPV